MNIMTKMETIVMNMTGCSRQTANLVVNTIWDEIYEAEEENKGKWITTIMGCVISCSKCGERLELCYPDGTEVRALPHCPHCGAKMQEDEE